MTRYDTVSADSTGSQMRESPTPGCSRTSGGPSPPLSSVHTSPPSTAIITSVTKWDYRISRGPCLRLSVYQNDRGRAPGIFGAVGRRCRSGRLGAHRRLYELRVAPLG